MNFMPKKEKKIKSKQGIIVRSININDQNNSLNL